MPLLIIPLIYIVSLMSFSMNCVADRLDKVDTGACRIVEIMTFGYSKDK